MKDKVLKELVKEFSRPRDEFGGESFITRRRDWFEKPMKNIRPLLEKDKLRKLNKQDAQKMYKEMTVGGPQLYPRSFIENGIERIRKDLEYLLYGKESLSERFYNVIDNLNSEYYLKGVGRAFASTALLLFNNKEYGIWNGAIEGGLKKMDLLPKRERGEHAGLTYVKILEVLKELQKKCSFSDLSVTDEFVELIYHGTIGEEIINQEPMIEEAEKEILVDEKKDLHLKMQWMLVKIGLWEGFDVWVASNDRNKKYHDDEFNQLCLEEIPHFAGPEVLKIAKSIDVIWFRKRSAQPEHFFEIEYTTSIYSGLLRLNDVRIDYPIPKATIVALSERQTLFESQISRRTFVHSELGEVCEFMSFNDLESLFKSEKIRAQMLKKY